MQNRNWKLVVPTYNREQLPVLKLLEQDPNLEITLAVRWEEEAKGMYEKYRKMSRVNVITLKDVHDIGETRAAIFNYAVESKLDQVVIVDDNIVKLFNRMVPSMSITDTIDLIIKTELQNNVAVNFLSDEYMYNGWWNNHHSMPVQAYILDVNKIKKLNINFVSTKLCGFEDFTFAYQLMKAGVTVKNSIYMQREGKSWLPTHAVAGGTHKSKINIEEVCNENDDKWIRCHLWLINQKWADPVKDIYTEFKEIDGHRFIKLKYHTGE